MRAWVAVTDKDWYRFLRQRPDLDEVNFWQPGGQRAFGTLSPGEPFLFKLHYPDNAIVGGGFFTHSSRVPASVAWDAFGEKNGASSYEEMCRRIERYRRTPLDPRGQHTIGRIILQEPFFFAEEDWLPAPADFQRQTVQGKTYDLREGIGRVLWEQVLERMRAARGPMVGEARREIPRDWQERPVRQRLGQGAFRVLVTDVYERRCAVTGEKALPVLQAAHIRPVTEEGPHRVDNGLLLRSDIHALFDQGYVTVTPDHRFRVSRRLKADFDNGEPYYPNGLALCKLHHAAFDRNILGITPALRVEVRLDILGEADGPMLRHGLQGFQGASIVTPRAAGLKPKPEFLAERYEMFRRAS